MTRYLKSAACYGFLCLAFVALSGQPAFAGVIFALGVLSGPPGSVIAAAFPLAASPNNDNAVTASPNFVAAGKTFAGLGFVDMQFAVDSSGGTTEYFVNEGVILGGVQNQTGVAWTGYNVELGFGVGDEFVPSSPADLLDFDLPGADPTPTNTVFTTLNHQGDRLTWTGGVLPHGGLMLATFSIDVPDVSGGIPPSEIISTGYRFTVRQYATPAAAPEPVTGMLLGLGLAAWAASRRVKHER
jgi:hypothetical protein